MHILVPGGAKGQASGGEGFTMKSFGVREMSYKLMFIATSADVGAGLRKGCRSTVVAGTGFALCDYVHIMHIMVLSDKLSRAIVQCMKLQHRW